MTYYDDFVLPADAKVTGIDFLDWWFRSSSPSDYLGTEWSIYDADPFTSSPIASGTAVAAITATGVFNAVVGDQFLFEIVSLDADLSGGTHYWLGIQNIVAGAGGTAVVVVHDPGGGLHSAKIADAGSYTSDIEVGGNRAFRVLGIPVPEPSTALLTTAGLVALARVRRQRRKAFRAT